MLIRIRRLAGSVVGAAFILLLAISLLGTGNSVNPMAFFQGSPVVIEVGDEKQRWNTLSTSDAIANALGLSAPAYASSGYGPLTTALAIKDAWNGGSLTLPRSLQEGLAFSLRQQGAFFTPDSLGTAFEQIEPMANIVTALNWQAESPNDLLPNVLTGIPTKHVTQVYDFELIDIQNDSEAIETPDDATLQTYVVENPDQFQRPQTWAIDALILDDIILAEQLSVTEDQVRLFYDQNLDLFTQEEAWDYQTLTFATAFEANLFKAQIDQGIDYDTAVANSTAKVSNQGLQENSAFSSETLTRLDQANVGVLTGPNEATDGTTTFSYLKAYAPERMETLEEAHDHAEQLLKLELAGEQLSETILDIQREANSIGLAAAVQTRGYELQSFDTLQTAESAPAALNSPGLFERLGFIREPRSTASRFELEPGAREMLFTVTSYEPQRPLNFEEAKEAALFVWKEVQAREQALAKAENLADILRSGISVDEAIAALNDPSIEIERRENLSRLNLSAIENPEFDLLAGLDRAALARFNGLIDDPLARGILNVNLRVNSPFTLPDGGVMVVDVIGGQSVIVAHHSRAPLDEDVRENLVNTLADTSVADLFAQALLLTYFDDVSSKRPATIDQDAINAQNLARQQALAQHSGGGI